MRNLAAILLALSLAACATAPNTMPAQISDAGKVDNLSTKSSPDTTIAPLNNAGVESAELAPEITALQKKSVYFDFDSYEIKPEYLGVIQEQAAFIKAHQNDIVNIEGNTDERGSDEYNLALGEKRADTVRKNLELLGVPASQIKTTSLGSEKPRMTCHEEKCWQENRRDDFVHEIGQR